MPRDGHAAARIAQIRAQLLEKSPNASVARELWSCGPSGTYAAYRQCLQHRRQAAAELQQSGPGGASAGGNANGLSSATCAAANPQSLPATVKYSFEGVKHVLSEASSAVTALAFAALRSDLLAFGCVDGELWLAVLPAAPSSAAQPTCSKARKMHGQSVQSVDWAFDNSQLLSAGRDGSLCVWDASDPAGSGLTCIRSVCVPTTAFLCARFHRVNFSLAMVGTSAGSLELFNCSTGMRHSRYQVAASGSGVQVTAVDSSNHHVFVGDSAGVLHWHTCELHGRQLSRLRPAGRLRLAGGGGGGTGPQAPSPVTALQYVPFCRTTDTPMLMAALQDGSLCIVRANEARHTADLYLRRAVSTVSPPVAGGSGGAGPVATSNSAAGSAPPLTALMRFGPAVCPLSVIQDVPLITYGSYDTSVYIVDVTARSFSGPAGAGGGMGGRGGGGAAAATGGAQSSAERPMTVTVLKAHRAAVTAVAWSYDEALLASADAEGMVVLWRRCRLF
ncbi:hypothetical protein PLESTB_001437700 [Pleodorina starrii]|uniref:Uncharacterized protein n=1 Tax=Pleodorina starrii TaxID=330485 RepID=A0A9W6BWC9_9CHLO|nr:hypothetical protein PLESTM_002011700 [Pleodorina starrii]GLC59047.1 hypothetical protein PLESTB_001437700 [Pleodorina starrii]GLC77116.1 hypothetical protein PLESTF_001886300 [Pleodorina starrii]